ncbi:DUF2523 domain-containing protein [Methylovorus menthalis]|uniref:DUF2523 domain-containing protein n=1 Tax=Methylovorus glucosotrophus (strain SIP3-4) TaxID=582744 RepID=C6XEU6_METGS|nr:MULTISPECIES: DUF2523 domain-containing protein [Methylovorus]ACT52153.1 conserved hypothetical protein [Methylovorus glucosotrophus SIP3-4]MCB4812443.1 DUF2523 domain-containing protein [Methylovorus menthalis]
MPLFISMFWGFAALSLKTLVGRVLVALAITYVTYQGLDVLLSGARQAALGLLTNVPADVIGAVGLLRLGESINIVFSAIAARYIVQGLTGGVLTRQVIK